MQINWQRVAEALKKIGYSGYITLEADRYAAACGAKTPADTQAVLGDLATRAKRLAKMVERGENER